MFGPISNPFSRLNPTSPLATSTTPGGGLILLLTSFYRLSIILAGLYTLINIILAGYGFLSAGGDVKLVQKAQERIWRSVVGLLIVVGAVLLSMIISWIVFGNFTTITNPVIYRP